jgi:hypothetical protein
MYLNFLIKLILKVLSEVEVKVLDGNERNIVYVAGQCDPLDHSASYIKNHT